MRRRTFFAALPFTAAAASAAAQTRRTESRQPNTDDTPAARRVPDAPPQLEVRAGDRISGTKWQSRSSVWGTQGAAATAHPTATMLAIETLRRGGSAIDAAITANAALGFLEPTGNGIGGDAFVMLWDPKQQKVVSLNGSGRSPRALTLETLKARAVNNHIPAYGAAPVTVPGTVDAWWTLHQRYGKLPWADVIEPAASLAEYGAPVPEVIAYYMGRAMAGFQRPERKIEEIANANRTYMPGGRTPREGEVFRNPDLARTYRIIATHGGRAFYEGDIAETIERYFRRIGGWMTRADLAGHRSEWAEPLMAWYRDVQVYGMPPNSQGLSTLQLLSILNEFDMAGMGFQSAASIHHQAEAKRLVFEDRARYFADPAFAPAPLAWLNSPEYAKQRAKLVRPDRLMRDIRPGTPPSPGDTTYFTTADSDGMMVWKGRLPGA